MGVEVLRGVREAPKSAPGIGHNTKLQSRANEGTLLDNVRS